MFQSKKLPNKKLRINIPERNRNTKRPYNSVSIARQLLQRQVFQEQGKQYSTHFSQYKQRIQIHKYNYSSESMDCIICLGDLQNPSTLSCCSKTFCRDCLNNWIRVRNCCPLCIRPLGGAQTNNLHSQNEEFDNGGLMLERQLADILSRYSYLHTSVLAKRQQSYNHKSSLSKHRLDFAEKQLLAIEQNIQLATFALSTNDRITTTSSLQFITEAIYEIQNVLQGNAQIHRKDYSSEEEWDHDNYHDQVYQKKKNSQKNIAPKNSKKNQMKA